MDRIDIPRRGFVLVCDGARAMILQNEGDAELVNLKLVDAFNQDDPMSHTLGTDRPGRVHQSHGDARSAVEIVDLHDEAETAFLKRILGELEGVLRERQGRYLAVIAPPRALGVLRESYPTQLRHLVKHELAKDLVQLPISQIERHLAGG